MKANKAKKEKAIEDAKEEENAEAADKVGKGQSDDADSYDDGGHEQSEYNDRLADEIEFSDEEDDVINNGMVELRNAAKYLAYKPPNRDKNKRILPKVDETRYFASIESKKPKVREAQNLKNLHK